MSRNIEVPLYRLAHARSGDKGNRLNIALICCDPRVLRDHCRAGDRGARSRAFRCATTRAKSCATSCRSCSPSTIVLDDVLEGGVNASLGLDGHGKSLSFFLLTHEDRGRIRLARAVHDAGIPRAFADVTKDNPMLRLIATAGCSPVLAERPRFSAQIQAPGAKLSERAIRFVVPFAPAAPPMRSRACSAQKLRTRRAGPS